MEQAETVWIGYTVLNTANISVSGLSSAKGVLINVSAHPDQRAIVYMLVRTRLLMELNRAAGLGPTNGRCVIGGDTHARSRLVAFRTVYPKDMPAIESYQSQIEEYISSTKPRYIAGILFPKLKEWIVCRKQSFRNTCASERVYANSCLVGRMQNDGCDPDLIPSLMTIGNMWGLDASLISRIIDVMDIPRLTADPFTILVDSVLTAPIDVRTHCPRVNLLLAGTKLSGSVYDVLSYHTHQASPGALLARPRVIFVVASMKSPVVCWMDPKCSYQSLLYRLLECIGTNVACSNAREIDSSIKDDIDDAVMIGILDMFAANMLCVDCTANRLVLALFNLIPHAFSDWRLPELCHVLHDTSQLIRGHHPLTSYTMLLSLVVCVIANRDTQYDARGDLLRVLCANQLSHGSNSLFTTPVDDATQKFAYPTTHPQKTGKHSPFVSIDNQAQYMRIAPRLFIRTPDREIDLIRVLTLAAKTFSETLFESGRCLSGFSSDFVFVYVPVSLMLSKWNSPYRVSLQKLHHVVCLYPHFISHVDERYFVHDQHGRGRCKFCDACMSEATYPAYKIPLSVITGEVVFDASVAAFSLETLMRITGVTPSPIGVGPVLGCASI
jgi:hypothetical protein